MFKRDIFYSILGMKLNKFRLGLLFLVAAIADIILIQYYSQISMGSFWSWFFSLLLPILLIVGCLLVGSGWGERKGVVYDHRHIRSPNSERNVRRVASPLLVSVAWIRLLRVRSGQVCRRSLAPFLWVRVATSTPSLGVP